VAFEIPCVNDDTLIYRCGDSLVALSNSKFPFNCFFWIRNEHSFKNYNRNYFQDKIWFTSTIQIDRAIGAQILNLTRTLEYRYLKGYVIGGNGLGICFLPIEGSHYKQQCAEHAPNADQITHGDDDIVVGAC
jgi:hypothetical protein